MASTKATYRAAEPLYEASCNAGSLQAWPPTQDSLQLFAGYLRESGAFAAPRVYFWAIVKSATAKGHKLPLAKYWCNGVVKGLKRNLPPQEQAAPLTIPLLHRLAAAATSQVNFTLVLSPAGAIFCASCSDSFLHLKLEDMQDVSTDKVWVILRHLKGEVRREVVDPVFGPLAPAPSGSEFADLATRLGPMRLCPVEVFRLLQDRALAAGEPYVAQCKSGKKLGRRIEELFRTRCLAASEPCTPCTAPASPPSATCSKQASAKRSSPSSDQVLCYGRRLALDPTVVGLWPFYNPGALAGAYAGGGSCSKAKGRRRKRLQGA